MRCLTYIDDFLAYFSTIEIYTTDVAHGTHEPHAHREEGWNLPYFNDQRNNIEWFMLLLLGVLSEQKKLEPVHNSKLTSLKIRCPCCKKNTGSYQTHQDTHISFWTCTLWMVYMLQLPISKQVSVWCYCWKAKPTIMLSEKLSGSITMSACVASWYLV